MPKCENCYHHDICNGRFDVEEYNCKCEDYKDKSLIIELPCKVGDTVYEVLPRLNKIIPSVVKGFGKGIMGDDNIDDDYDCFDIDDEDDEEKSSSDELYIRFDNAFVSTTAPISDFKENIFLTYEEAKKALAEKTKEN